VREWLICGLLPGFELVASSTFAFTYATLAAKSRRAEMVLIPLLDVLQSVPVLSAAILTLPLQLRFLRPQVPATTAKRASVDLSQRLCGRLMGWSGRPARFQARRFSRTAQ